jgi:hypothetical protein
MNLRSKITKGQEGRAYVPCQIGCNPKRFMRLGYEADLGAVNTSVYVKDNSVLPQAVCDTAYCVTHVARVTPFGKCNNCNVCDIRDVSHCGAKWKQSGMKRHKNAHMQWFNECGEVTRKCDG